MISTVPLLTGERIQLRPYVHGFSAEELVALYSWGRDSELLELAGGSHLDMSFERFSEMFLMQLRRRNSDNEQLFAILDEDRRMIGRVGLFGLASSSRSAELGIVIGERDRWGNGYGRDAVRTIVVYGFETLDLQRIYLFTFLHNERAQAAFRACGFRRVRRLRRFSFDRGIHTELEMELLSPES